MKVILLRDVAKIGRRSEVVDVPNGYARNQLIPKGMAEPASAANMKKIHKMNVEQETAVAKATEEFDSAMSVLKKGTVKVAVELNEKNHAFKAVSNNEIVVAAKELGVTITPEMISIANPIKEAGKHSVTLKSGTKEAEFEVEVVKK